MPAADRLIIFQAFRTDRPSRNRWWTFARDLSGEGPHPWVSMGTSMNRTQAEAMAWSLGWLDASARVAAFDAQEQQQHDQGIDFGHDLKAPAGFVSLPRRVRARAAAAAPKGV